MEIIPANFDLAMTFWFFLPAPALCGDQAKKTDTFYNPYLSSKYTNDAMAALPI